MSTQLAEWETLSADWRAETPGADSDAAVDALRRRVRNHGRRQVALLASEIAMSIGCLVAVRWFWSQPGGRGVLTVAWTVAMLVVVWSFVLWNRRGSWRPLGESTSEYIRLSYVRARAGRRTVRFVRVVLGLSAAGYVPWFVVRLSRDAIHGAEWWSWGTFAVYASVYLWWCSWYSRRLDREVEALCAVERDLAA